MIDLRLKEWSFMVRAARVLPAPGRSARVLKRYRRFRWLSTLHLACIDLDMTSRESNLESQHVRLSSEQVERLNAWRRQQPDLPSKAEAIRRLLDLGLEAANERSSTKAPS